MAISRSVDYKTEGRERAFQTRFLSSSHPAQEAQVYDYPWLEASPAESDSAYQISFRAILAHGRPQGVYFATKRSNIVAGMRLAASRINIIANPFLAIPDALCGIRTRYISANLSLLTG